MKIGTTELVKFKRLKGRLKLSLWQAIGLLESLWMFTAKNAPSGDIGRFTDEDIAFGIEWEGDPTELIQTLIETHWMDANEQHRLVIHDWCDHVPNWLRGNFAKHGKSFAVEVAKQPAKQVTKQRAKQPAKHVAEQTAYSTLPPIQFNSSHVNSSLGDAHAREEDEAPLVEHQCRDGPAEWAEDEQRLIQQWNSCPNGARGVVTHRGAFLSPKLREAFRCVWDDPVRRGAMFDAVARIKSGIAFEWDRPALSLAKFLESDEIDKIIGGGHAKHIRASERPLGRVDGAADIAARPRQLTVEEFLALPNRSV